MDKDINKTPNAYISSTIGSLLSDDTPDLKYVPGDYLVQILGERDKRRISLMPFTPKQKIGSSPFQVDE